MFQSRRNRLLRYLLFPLWGLFFFQTPLSAETQSSTAQPPEPLAKIVSIEGSGFTLVREGDSRDYGADEALSLPLQGGDLLLTGPGCWLEILLPASESLLKIAENTTFSLKQLTREGGGVFELDYGRVLARAGDLPQDVPFWIQGPHSTAGAPADDTDFGFDFFYSPETEGEKILGVNCLAGKVEVVRRLVLKEGEVYHPDDDFARGKDKSSTVTLRPGQMVRFPENPGEEKLKKSSLDDEVRSYWALHDFRYPGEAAAVPELLPDLSEEARQMRQAGWFCTLTGAALAGAGAAAYFGAGNGSMGLGFSAVGGALFCSGGYFLIRSAREP